MTEKLIKAKVTEKERRRQVLAARTKALANELLALDQVCRSLVEQVEQVGRAAKALRLELDPEASDG